MLLEIRFLDGYYGADKDRNRDWPPSPGRLFSAVVNAFGTMSRCGEKMGKDVLLWFENLVAPDSPS